MTKHIYLNRDSGSDSSPPMERPLKHPFKESSYEGREYYKIGQSRIIPGGLWKAGRLGLVILGHLGCVFTFGILPCTSTSFTKWFDRRREEWSTGAQKVKYYTLRLTPQEIQQKHDQLINGHPIPPLIGNMEYSPGNSAYLMEGISILADRLCEKNHVSELYVCKNLPAFQEQLEAIKRTNNDFRLALIVPTHGSLSSGMQAKAKKKKLEDWEQHKVCVAIERKDGFLKIAVLDSCPKEHNRDVSQANVNLEEREPYNEQELICSYIQAAKLPHYKFQVFASKVMREYGSGCSTFALKDAIAFLKDQDFFLRITHTKNEFGLPHNPVYITKLPPNFMKTTQSLTIISKYISSNPYSNQETLGKRQLNLQQSVARHTVLTNARPKNKFIDNRVYKYKLYLLDLLSTKTDAEVNALINRRLLRPL